MAEKWRVAIVLSDAAGAGRSGLWRGKRDVAREIQDRTGGTVVVAGAPGPGLTARLGARLDSPMSAYTDNRAAAETAARVAREVAGRHGLTAQVTVECWRPVKERWEDASAVSQRDLDEERDDQERADRRRSAETGVAQWRVCVELRTHGDAVALAQRLSQDGHRVSQSRKSVLADADSEDEARRLADQAQQYAPSDAKINTERTDTPTYTGEDPASGPPDLPAW